MLTKNDLKLLAEQTRTIVQEEIKPLKKDMKTLQKDMKVVKKQIKEIKDDQNSIINFFNRENLELKGRVDKIENHLGLRS